MFVKIDNSNNAFDVDTIINKTRDNNELSPKKAMEILRMGNYYGNIKKLLKIIYNLGESKWGEYKEFVLSVADRRKVSSETFDILTDIAKAGGYEKELADVDAKEKIYSAKMNKVVCSEGRYIQEDLSKYDVIHHKYEGIVVVWDAKLPKVADFSECKSSIDFRMTDCSGVEKFYFADDYSVVRFLQIGKTLNKGKMPKVLDLSGVNNVTFDQCNFAGCEEIKFKEGAGVTFIYTENHPKKLDFSMCAYLEGDLYANDVKEIVFLHHQQAEVFMEHIHQFEGKVMILSQLEAQKRRDEKKAKKDAKKNNNENKSLWERIFSKNIEN